MAYIHNYDHLFAEGFGVKHPTLQTIARRCGPESMMQAIIMIPKVGQNTVNITDDTRTKGYRSEVVTLDDLRNLCDKDKSFIRDCYDTFYGTRYDETEPQIAEFFHTL